MHDQSHCPADQAPSQRWLCLFSLMNHTCMDPTLATPYLFPFVIFFQPRTAAPPPSPVMAASTDRVAAPSPRRWPRMERAAASLEWSASPPPSPRSEDHCRDGSRLHPARRRLCPTRRHCDRGPALPPARRPSPDLYRATLCRVGPSPTSIAPPCAGWGCRPPPRRTLPTIEAATDPTRSCSTTAAPPPARARQPPTTLLTGLSRPCLLFIPRMRRRTMLQILSSGAIMATRRSYKGCGVRHRPHNASPNRRCGCCERSTKVLQTVGR
jgi:hypothetical protein